jgi:hypothetical protein
MPKLKVYAFSQHIGNLCVTHDTKVHKLGAKLGIDPAELVAQDGFKACCRFSLITRTPTLIGKGIPLPPMRRIYLNLKNYPLVCRKSGVRIVTNFLA